MLSRGCTRRAQCERFRGPGLEKHFKKMDRMLCRVPFRKLQNIMKSLASSGENSPLPSCLQETDSVKGIKDILAVQQAAGVPCSGSLSPWLKDRFICSQSPVDCEAHNFILI